VLDLSRSDVTLGYRLFETVSALSRFEIQQLVEHGPAARLFHFSRCSIPEHRQLPCRL